MSRRIKSRRIVLERKDSGEIYSKLAPPFSTRSIASLRSKGESNPLMVTASVRLCRFLKTSTWSFIKDCKGEIITVKDRLAAPLIKAGN